jgi:hypothetical protein
MNRVQKEKLAQLKQDEKRLEEQSAQHVQPKYLDDNEGSCLVT